jgi:hypothetical protein
VPLGALNSINNPWKVPRGSKNKRSGVPFRYPIRIIFIAIPADIINPEGAIVKRRSG